MEGPGVSSMRAVDLALQIDPTPPISAHMRYLDYPRPPPILPVMGGLGCSSNELVDLGARSKELPLVGYAFERVCAI